MAFLGFTSLQRWLFLLSDHHSTIHIGLSQPDIKLTLWSKHRSKITIFWTSQNSFLRVRHVLWDNSKDVPSIYYSLSGLFCEPTGFEVSRFHDTSTHRVFDFCMSRQGKWECFAPLCCGWATPITECPQVSLKFGDAPAGELHFWHIKQNDDFCVAQIQLLIYIRHPEHVSASFLQIIGNFDS